MNTTPEDEWDEIERRQAEEAARWDAYWEGLSPEGRQREREMMALHYEERSRA